MLDPASHANKSAIERHHLFAKNHLKSLGITEARDTNQIANYALVEWSDNIAISDGAPAHYYPKYTQPLLTRGTETDDFWHALPDGWEGMDYPDFLHERGNGSPRSSDLGFKVLCES